MKATVLYCDRCAVEGNREVRAIHIVWIRTSLGGRTMRLDVCSDHFALIVGQASPNGAAPPTVAPTVAPTAPPGKRVWHPSAEQTRTAYERLVKFAGTRPRFSYEDALACVGKEINEKRVGVVLRMLADDGKLERYMMGIYQRPGFRMPEPATVELAAAAVVKLAKATPGIRATSAAALAGIESQKLWKPTLDYVREQKLVRAKGTKSAMRLYAL
jgi:hypothetical protein